MTIILATPRLEVRHFHVDDTEALFTICGDPIVMRWVDDGKPLTRDLCEKWIDISRQNYQTKGYGACAVIERASGAMIGYAGLVHGSTRKEPEIIYGFVPSVWGRGLASELVPPLLEHGLNACGLSRMIATIDPENVASQRVVERSGMRFEMTEMDEHGLGIRVYAFSREDSDWLIRRGEADDLDQLVVLCASTFRETYGPHSPMEDVERHIALHFTRAHIEAELADPKSTTLVAMLAGKLVGYVLLRSGRTTACVTGPDPIQLSRIYLSVGSIGQGHGSSLMSASLAEARRMGGRTLWLSLWDQNHRALKFYIRWGFQQVGLMDFEFGGHPYVDPVMARAL